VHPDAKITTSLTVAELKTGIESYQDLAGKRVGVTNGSSQQKFLNTKNIKTIAFPTLTALYRALKDGAIDAIVADLPILPYYVSHEGAGWMVLSGQPFNPEYLGIMMPEDSAYKEVIDRALLEIQEEGRYGNLYTKYFRDKHASY